MMNNRTIIVVALLLLLLWLVLKERASAATTRDDRIVGGGAPTFGTDHVADAAQATASAPLVSVPPAPPGPTIRTPEEIQADIVTQYSNPSYVASITDPSVAASNAYYGQFIGKIS